jgi:NAD(P)-dependent dehydrogenase (short-subunit alcohol dehydrogenase family)
MRPRPQRPLRPAVVPVPASMLARMQAWVWRHKILTGVVVVATGVIIYRSYRNSAMCRKTRRARRARSGGRIEVVVIAGSPTLPLTRSLSLDMERKGFIVFVVCNSVEDEMLVQSLSRPDIKALSIDITDVSFCCLVHDLPGDAFFFFFSLPSPLFLFLLETKKPWLTTHLKPPSAGASVERFAQYLQSPHAPVPKAKSHLLELRAVVLIPSLNYQTSPIATIPPSSFADLFNTHLLHPILTIQSFLPLLTTRLAPTRSEKASSPKVLVFTPSIISSINPPFHAPEATVCSALSAFTEVLTAELRPLNIPVTHIQLGTFDFAGFTPATGMPARNGPAITVGRDHYLPAAESNSAAETLAWPESARHTYGRNFLNQSGSAISAGRIRGLRGSSLRDLHNAVFDVIDGSNTSGIVRLGLGASVYGFVGRWVPRGLVAWMMGIRRVDELAMWYPSSANSPRSASAGSDGGEGASLDFVAVPLDSTADAHVWKEG